MVRNKATRRYLRKLRWLLPCKWKEKRIIISQIKGMLEQYLTECSGVKYDDLISRFGTPEEVVQNYLENMENTELARQMLLKNKVLKIALVTACVLVLLWAGVVCAAYLRYIDDHNGYFIVTIETIGE